MKPLSKIICGFSVILLIAYGFIATNVANAGNTAFEMVTPAQTSTVFVPSSREQVLGVPPSVSKVGAINLQEFPALWIITDPSETIVMLPDLELNSLDKDEVIIPVARTKIKKRKRKARVKKTRQEHIKVAAVTCVPETINKSALVNVKTVNPPLANPIQKDK